MEQQEEQETYSSRFKARVALQADGEKSIRELSNKYATPIPKIREWVQQFRENVDDLFIDSWQSNQANITQDPHDLLYNILEASPNGVLATTLEQKVITYNHKCVEIWKLPKQVAATGTMKAALPCILKLAKDPDLFQYLIKDMYANPEKKINQIIELKDGRFIRWHSIPYRSGEKIIGRVATFEDITDFKKSEDKASRKGKLLYSINTNINEGIIRSTPGGEVVYANQAFADMLGYKSLNDVMAMNPADFYAQDGDRRQMLKKLEENGSFNNEEVLFRREDGSEFWALVNTAVSRQNGEMYLDAAISNVDGRKKAEQALRESEEKYRTIIREIEEGYFETNLEGDFSFFNSALLSMMGYSAEELMGMNYREYMTNKEAQNAFETFNVIYKTGESGNAFDWELICGDGSCIYVESSISLRRDSDENPVGFRGVVRDITERKQKRKEIQNSLREKEVLLGEIHHRVKNNLAVISGLLFLQSDKTDDKNAQRALKESQNRINSMALIHELLYDNKTFASLNPSDYIEQLVEHISANMQKGQKDIQTKIKAEGFDLGLNTAIPCALMINELITNAHKYAFKGRQKGTVTIIFKKDKGGTYHLVVADDGCGLPEGFDINDSGQHSLGLSLVKTLTRQLNGKLHSENDNGARFVITFKGE